MAIDVVLSEEDLRNLLSVKREECEKAAARDAFLDAVLFCGTIWDGIMCWPSALPDQLSSQPCPLYFPGLDRLANATKECTENGTWFVSRETQKEWTNYSQCYVGEETMIVVPVTTVNTSIFKDYLPLLKALSHVGYGVSLSTLAIAFVILVTLKKLHCSRNMLHLHLFMSFIMKAVITFAKEFLFEQGVGLHSDFVVRNGTSYFVEKMNSNWECKAITTIWQYFIMANYSWVLMEALYIHNLIIFALFTDDGSILVYAVLGWGLPLVFVVAWVIVKIHVENEFCWTTNTDSKNFLIIRVPTIASILLSFVLFVNVVRLLMRKVRSAVQEERRRYWKLAKSTLILIPLFGVHYAIFHVMSYSRGFCEEMELVWLFCDQFFASFQGFFVAVLFCFLNGEIQTELKKKWRWLLCCGNRCESGEWLHHRCLERLCPQTWYCSGGSNGSRTSGLRLERRASKRTDTMDFMTNDSVIPMMALEKEKRVRGTPGDGNDTDYGRAHQELFRD